MRKYLAEFGLCITAIVWGSGFVASAIALDHYTPFQIMAIRFTVGAIILAIIFYKKLSAITTNTIIKGSILGVVLYLAFVLQTVGLQYTTPSKNAFLTAVNVIIVPFIGYLLYRKRLDKFELFGAFFAIIGIGLISLHFPFSLNIGDLLTIGCAVLFALQIFYTSVFVKKEDALALTLVQMTVASLCGIIGVFIKGEQAITYSVEAIWPVLYLGIFATSLAYILQTVAQKYMSETKTAIILSTESLWGMIFSILILQEIITFKMALGAVLILLAIVLTETKLNFKQKPKHRSIESKLR